MPEMEDALRLISNERLKMEIEDPTVKDKSARIIDLLHICAHIVRQQRPLQARVGTRGKVDRDNDAGVAAHCFYGRS